MKYITLIIIIMSGVFYQIFSKSIPSTVNPFASLIVTYTVALIMAFILYFLTSKVSIFEEIKNLNSSSILLGVVICFYELGFVLAYRNGFNIVNLSPIANVFVMVILVPVGFIFFKEHMTSTHILGLIIAATGILIAMK